MATSITVDPTQPLDHIGGHILDAAGINLARSSALVREHGTDSALTTILATLAERGIQVVTADGTPYDPTDAVRTAVESVA